MIKKMFVNWIRSRFTPPVQAVRGTSSSTDPFAYAGASKQSRRSGLCPRSSFCKTNPTSHPPSLPNAPESRSPMREAWFVDGRTAPRLRLSGP